MMPKISVIIPVFNKEDYLDECLGSILSQNLEGVEIVCVNDGSTDSSLSLLNEYASKHNCIVVVDQSNRGVGYARNVGIEHSSGEFIAFMDPDDFYPDKNTLKDLYEAAKSNSVAICGGSFSSLKSGQIITTYSGLNSKYIFSEDCLMEYRNYQFDYGFQRFIFSSKLIKENSIKFPNYIRFQDPPFLVRAMATAGTFYALERVTYRYREAYREINWNLCKKIDLIKGLTDNLKLSKELGYPELNSLETHRLTSDHDTEIILHNNNRFERKVLRKVIDDALSHVIDSDDQARVAELIRKLEADRFELEKTPLITVVIPIYKVEGYIDDCINSVLNQENPGDLQIICVDDGSPDRCGEICESYADRDLRIQVIHKVNGGLSSARNAGAEYAQGKYLYFLDSDDLLRPDALRSICAVMETNRLDVLYFDAETFFDSQEVENANRGFKEFYRNRNAPCEVMSGEELMRHFVEGDAYRTPVQLCALNAEFYRNRGLNFCDGVLHEDNLFTFTCLLEAERAMYVNEAWYLRRIRGDSIMTAHKSFKNYYGFLKCASEMSNYLERNPDKADVGKRVLERTLITMRYTYDALEPKEKIKTETLPLKDQASIARLDTDTRISDYPFVTVFVRYNENGIDCCIASLSNQTVAIRCYVVDGATDDTSCPTVTSEEVQRIIESSARPCIIVDGSKQYSSEMVADCIHYLEINNCSRLISEDGSIEVMFVTKDETTSIIPNDYIVKCEGAQKGSRIIAPSANVSAGHENPIGRIFNKLLGRGK